MTDGPLEQLLQELARRIASELAQLAPPQPPTAEKAASSPWLNIASTARYLDWPKQRLYKLTAAGAIPHYKHDGRLLFHRPELDAWLGEHAQPQQRLAPPRKPS